MKREQSEVLVEYDFGCCFCGTPIVTTGKTVTCANCGKTLKIARVGTHGQYWKATPSLDGQDTLKQGEAGDPVSIMASLLLAVYLYGVVCLGQYVFGLDQ